MVKIRRTAALVAAAALALPAGAFAQGAGETQYSDPLEGERAQTGGGGGGGNTGSSGSGQGAQTGTGGGGELSNRPPAGGNGEAQAAQTRTPRGELARTGAEPALIALLGAGFVLTGAGLRVRVRPPLA